MIVVIRRTFAEMTGTVVFLWGTTVSHVQLQCLSVQYIKYCTCPGTLSDMSLLFK